MGRLYKKSYVLVRLCIVFSAIATFQLGLFTARLDAQAPTPTTSLATPTLTLSPPAVGTFSPEQTTVTATTQLSATLPAPESSQAGQSRDTRTHKRLVGIAHANAGGGVAAHVRGRDSVTSEYWATRRNNHRQSQ